MGRRAVLQAIAALAAAGTGAARAQAAWPARPIRVVVPYPAGGNADAVARLISPALSERLGQQILVDNRPGGGGVVGATAVAKAQADGYTLLFDATAFTVNPTLQPQLPYDAARDFVPLSLLVQVPLLLVVPANSPYHSVADIVRAAKAAPGTLSYASAGNGGAQHLAGELFKQSEKIFITHIPYRGGAPALTDLIGGQVQMMFSAVTACAGFVKSGKLRALAVTAEQRFAALPQVPTMAESGVPGFKASEWNGLFAPAATPPAVLERIERDARATLADPAVQQKLRETGVDVVGSSRADFARFIASETARWATVIRTAGIKID
ncbi:tripartite tricarboxylate transporter substrate binding protein [Xylophilus rhododendri]|uniref:Tripartite tricarboxylate transporter substrate binding protein n=2 Tax=Xylophilus rhododendri TaxID=2697032 RepID=A0A857JFK0_9BURK|nr:tripartite tricarboxylate transporter substrate binding protein [Xylophilus rhododendri]